MILTKPSAGPSKKRVNSTHSRQFRRISFNTDTVALRESFVQDWCMEDLNEQTEYAAA